MDWHMQLAGEDRSLWDTINFVESVWNLNPNEKRVVVLNVVLLFTCVPISEAIDLLYKFICDNEIDVGARANEFKQHAQCSVQR